MPKIPKYRPDPGFPKHLLERSIEERLAYFEEYVVRHRNFRRALLKVFRLMKRSKQYALIYLIGPTGAGKSELLDQLKYILIGFLRNKLRKDPGMLPFVAIAAREPRVGNYNFSAQDRDILIAIDEPLIDYKLPMPVEEWRRTHKGKAPPRNALGVHLEFAVEQALRGRHPLVLMIDDAHYIAVVASPRKLDDHAHVLRTSARNTLVRHLLVGTYELDALCNLDGQHSRISREVYFPAYQLTPEDFEIFVKVVVTLEHHLPLPKPPDLKPLAKYLFDGSCGRVGVLKDWLYDTLADVLDRGSSTITKEDLERNALSKKKLDKLRAEVQGTGSEVLDFLLPSDTPEHQEAQEQNTSNSKTAASNGDRKRQHEAKSTPRRTRRRVGERKPVRDPVGKSSGL